MTRSAALSTIDLTKQVDRCKVSLMGAAGDKTQLSKNDGVVAYSTIISVSESPVMPGVVWAGTDDGNLQVSRDGGVTFTEVGKNLPGLPANHDYWVARVDASHFDAGTAYVAVDGHRSDDLKPYAFVTRDYGKTFQSIANTLPAYGNLQVIREDPKNKDLLYVGTEFGLFANLRPVRLPKVLSPACPLRPERQGDGLDILVVRELTGGLYFGQPKQTTSLPDGDVQASCGKGPTRERPL